MVTKEQCILERILDLAEYGARGDRFLKYLINIFNEGKRYASEMVFMNDDVGIEEVLGGMSEDDAEYFVSEMESGNGPYYDNTDPLITFEQGIKSLDMDDFKKMLTPEMMNKIVTNDVVLANLDGSDYQDAFEMYVKANYPDRAKNWNADWEEQYLYDTDFRTADWDQLAETLGGNMMRLSESDLREMTNRILKEVIRRRKK